MFVGDTVHSFNSCHIHDCVHYAVCSIWILDRRFNLVLQRGMSVAEERCGIEHQGYLSNHIFVLFTPLRCMATIIT